MNKNNNEDKPKNRLFSEEEKSEYWKKGINPGQGNTKSYKKAAPKLLKTLGFNFVKEHIIDLREKLNEPSKNKKNK